MNRLFILLLIASVAFINGSGARADDFEVIDFPPDEVLNAINSFTLYTVNSQIVALAALIDYEDCQELAKLCTLPRYQARGRARQLVLELLKKSREAGKRGLFALTVSDNVGEFFQQLGFEACQRDTLPQAWQDSYDFERPSKSYFFRFEDP